MSLQEQFEDASDRVEKLSDRPDNDTLLELYALYKQATDGDVSGSKPSRLKMRARAKYEAREERQGMSSDDAMQAYIDLVDKLVKQDS